MTILHLAMGHPEFDRSARELGHEVTRVEHRTKEGAANPMFASNLRAATEGKTYDLCFAQLQGFPMSPEWWAMVASTGAFVVEWCGDVRDPIPNHYAKNAPFVDVTAFSNMTDVVTFNREGWRSEYLQIGYDETFYTPGNEVRGGVVFLGNNYPARFPESASRAKMVAAMQRAFGPRFTVYGRGWRPGSVSTTPEAERAIYQRALVAVNWDHFHRPYFASDRILRAQSCGCVVVTQEYEGREQEHPFAVAVTSIEGAVEAVRGLLDGSDLGEKAARHTREKHTWHARIETMERWAQ